MGSVQGSQKQKIEIFLLPNMIESFEANRMSYFPHRPYDSFLWKFNFKNDPYSSFRLKTTFWEQNDKNLNNFGVTTDMLFRDLKISFID